MRHAETVLCVSDKDLPATGEAHTGAPSAPARLPAWKRVLDLTCLVLSLPLVLPLALGIAALIKLVSPGPVFFRQERVGFRGQRFVCWKFRTMKYKADTTAHQQHLRQLMTSDTPMTKMDQGNDPRLIPGGLLLRATGLDELAQLINVFRGEMSCVGPRPCTAYEYEQYQPWQRERFAAVPGLTGLWQVSGKNKTTFNQMIELDLYYAENQSLRLDLFIMLKTVPTLLGQVAETACLRLRRLGLIRPAGAELGQ